MSQYFKPWKGHQYEHGGVLILSESTYKWVGEGGESYTPTPEHAQDGVPLSIGKFEDSKGYFKSLNKALAMKENPSSDHLKSIWNELAYCPFVQEPLEDKHHRPKRSQWEDACENFLKLLEDLRPGKVIITGKTMWSQMPDCKVRLLNDLQAYNLNDGSLVWCLALPHPCNRIEGFQWERVGESIQAFRATEFPSSFSDINADYST